MRNLVILLGLLFIASVSAQTPAHSLTSTIKEIEYTDSQLLSFGFNQDELAEYHRRLNSLEGQWWGHLSPMEMMMYSATTESERRRFAKMYLTTNNPKAQAERKSALAMYEVARELMADELTASLSAIDAKRLIIFVNHGCKSCGNEVRQAINNASEKVDIYVTDLDPDKDSKQQLIDWATSLSLPPQKVTLNDDNGIYQKSYGHRLTTFTVLSE